MIIRLVVIATQRQLSRSARQTFQNPPRRPEQRPLRPRLPGIQRAEG